MNSPVKLLRGSPPRFDLRAIKNCRFMWCLRTNELILGSADIAGSSHAREHGESGASARFDEFVRGWVGFGGSYRNGIIHFAPPFRTEMTAEQFDELCSTLSVFIENGADGRIVLRGAGMPQWETTLAKAYPEFLAARIHRRATVRVATNIAHLGAMTA